MNLRSGRGLRDFIVAPAEPLYTHSLSLSIINIMYFHASNLSGPSCARIGRRCGRQRVVDAAVPVALLYKHLLQVDLALVVSRRRRNIGVRSIVLVSVSVILAMILAPPRMVRTELEIMAVEAPRLGRLRRRELGALDAERHLRPQRLVEVPPATTWRERQLDAADTSRKEARLQREWFGHGQLVPNPEWKREGAGPRQRRSWLDGLGLDLKPRPALQDGGDRHRRRVGADAPIPSLIVLAEESSSSTSVQSVCLSGGSRPRLRPKS